MGSDLNRVELLGRLGQDPEVRNFQNGGSVCNLSVATSQRWKDRNTGEKREITQWHRVSIFAEGLVGVAQQYLRKGSRVFVEGALETRKWQDQNGQDRYSTEVVLRPYAGRLIMLDSRQDGQQGGYSGGGQGGAGQGSGYGHDSGAHQGYGGGSGQGQSPRPDLDDEIPF